MWTSKELRCILRMRFWTTKYMDHLLRCLFLVQECIDADLADFDDRQIPVFSFGLNTTSSMCVERGRISPRVKQSCIRCVHVSGNHKYFTIFLRFECILLCFGLVLMKLKFLLVKHRIFVYFVWFPALIHIGR